MINHPPPGATVADLPGPLHDFVPHFLAFFFFFFGGCNFAGQHGRQLSRGVGEAFCQREQVLRPGGGVSRACFLFQRSYLLTAVANLSDL